LVAASKDDVALSPAGETYTRFSGCLLRALQEGVPSAGDKVSLADLGEWVVNLLHQEDGRGTARPEVHAPRQTDGDVSRLPFFPNAARPREREDAVSAGGQRRPRRWLAVSRARLRWLAAISVALVTLASIAPIVSVVKARRLARTTAEIVDAVRDLNLRDPRVPTLDKLGALDKLRTHMEYLRANKENDLYARIRGVYIAILNQGFIRPTKWQLERKLDRATGTEYLTDYNNFKAYLLLGDRIHLQENAEWEKGRLIQSWAELLGAIKGDVSEPELEARLLEHVAQYVDLVKNAEAQGETLDERLCSSVRDRLTRGGSALRYYDQFVTALIDQRADETAPPSLQNRQYPPFSLASVFADRPEVLTRVRSRRHEQDGRWVLVEGPYTRKGHDQVLLSLEQGRKRLDVETWVLPFTDEEKKAGDVIARILAQTRTAYDAQYIRQWETFFSDIDVQVPTSNEDALAELQILTTPDWPFQRLLQVLADNTQFDDVLDRPEAEGGLAGDGGVIDKLRRREAHRMDPKARAGDPVSEKFRSMAGFGVLAAHPRSEGAAPPAPAALDAYVDALVSLVAKLKTTRGVVDAPAADMLFASAAETTWKLIQKMDSTGRDLMKPLLLAPLQPNRGHGRSR
jgi:type VI secretion system protein ImpL